MNILEMFWYVNFEPVEKFYIRNKIFKVLPADLNTHTFCKVELDIGRIA